jgi:arginine exporter protein ArgO
VVWLASFLGMMLSDISTEASIIIFLTVTIVGLVLLLLVNIRIFKSIWKRAKELKVIIKANPEIVAEVKQKERKSYLIRVAIAAIVFFVILCFINSMTPDKYEGYSADYEFNEEYREAVDDFAEEVNADPKAIYNIIQYFGRFS